MTNQNTGDSSTSTEVDGSIPVIGNRGLGLTELAKQFSGVDATLEVLGENNNPDVEIQEDSTEEAVTSEVSEALDGEADVEEQEEADELDDKGNVLSQNDKALKKMRKRIDKATKNWRTAEEELAILREENQRLKSRGEHSEKIERPEQPKGFSQKVESAESIDDLKKIQETARNVKQTAKRLIRQLEETGESEVQYNGKTLTKVEIYDALDDAEEALEEHIVKKADLLQSRAEYDKVALQNFDFLKDTNSEQYKFAEQVMSDKGMNAFLNSRPDQFYILGLLAEGKRALDARQKSKDAKPSESKVDAPKKIAPSIPGIRSTVAPAKTSMDDAKSKRRAEIASKNKHSTHDLATLFSGT